MPQTIITNFQTSPDIFHQYHEICASTNKICIYGYKDKIPDSIVIQHNCREWCTLFLEYQITTSHIEGTFMVNNDSTTTGDFILDKPQIDASGLYVGSRYDYPRNSKLFS